MPKSPGKIPALIVQYEEYDKNAVEKAIRDIENSSGNPKEKRPEDQSEYEAAAEVFLKECGLPAPQRETCGLQGRRGWRSRRPLSKHV